MSGSHRHSSAEPLTAAKAYYLSGLGEQHRISLYYERHVFNVITLPRWCYLIHITTIASGRGVSPPPLFLLVIYLPLTELVVAGIVQTR